MEKERKRWYSFKCITYLPLSDLMVKLTGEQVTHYAIGYHDKDKKEDSEELKEPHYHVLVIFRGNKSVEACRRYFEEGSDQNTLAKPIEDLEHDYRYLLHKDDPDKYQYPESARVTDGSAFWKRLDKESGSKGKPSDEDFIDDLLSTKYSKEKMARKWGRDFIKNYKVYEDFRSDVLTERFDEERYKQEVYTNKRKEKLFDLESDDELLENNE